MKPTLSKTKLNIAATVAALFCFAEVAEGAKTSGRSNATKQGVLLLASPESLSTRPVREAVREYALNRRVELGLPVDSELSEAKAHSTRFGASFHMTQTVRGVPVWLGKVVVVVDANRQVRMINNSVQHYERAQNNFDVTAQQAIDIASTQTPLARLHPETGSGLGSARQQFFAIHGELRAGYLAHASSVNPLENWLMAIDAQTGETLFKQNRVFYSKLSASVYASSPGGLDAGVGITPTTNVELVRSDGGSMVLDIDGGFLLGHQLNATNCCPSENCNPDAGPRIETGTLNFGGFPVAYDVSVCDPLPRANNASSGDAGYTYSPIDPPTLPTVSQAEPADSDLFAEVHGFYHANLAYDFFRELSAGAQTIFPGEGITEFVMRDTAADPNVKPLVWANLTLPDFNDALSSLPNVMTRKLIRLDNAAFLPKENADQLFITNYLPDTDVFLLFQGNTADFGYDAPVVWHEFGHGMIYSTANINIGGAALDERSANNEGGALHEGLADFFAAALGNDPVIGAYVGPRLASINNSPVFNSQDANLRSLDGTDQCPDVLWGEVHQDSKHFSQALWQARSQHFQGADQGATFDAAVYAAVVALTPNANFKLAAEAVIAHMNMAFPSISGADGLMRDAFENRAVLNCSKVLDVSNLTAARPLYNIPDPSSLSLANNTAIPGPFQMKIDGAQGVASFTVAANQAAGGPFSQPPTVFVAYKQGAAITYTPNGANLSNDADSVATLSGQGGTLSSTITVDAPCGTDVFFTLSSASAANLQNLDVSWSPLAGGCPSNTDGGEDAGTNPNTDAGSSTPDAGTPATDGGDSEVEPPTGCGCRATQSSMFWMLFLLLLPWVRKNRSS